MSRVLASDMYGLMNSADDCMFDVNFNYEDIKESKEVQEFSKQVENAQTYKNVVDYILVYLKNKYGLEFINDILSLR